MLSFQKLGSIEKNVLAPGPGPAIIHAPEFEYLSVFRSIKAIFKKTEIFNNIPQM